jgi:hypothetical protein
MYGIALHLIEVYRLAELVFAHKVNLVPAFAISFSRSKNFILIPFRNRQFRTVQFQTSRFGRESCHNSPVK